MSTEGTSPVMAGCVCSVNYILGPCIVRYRISSNTAWVSNWTQLNLPIQIEKSTSFCLDFNLILIWTWVIMDHEID